MASLLLALIIVALFAILFGYETADGEAKIRLNPSGLLAWLVSGNWPAKVGAGLVIIGIGALLRYAFANIEVPPELKLGSGALLAAALGFASMMLERQPKRRAIHLALAGSAFGVAYLTAYSAYGFFNYINDINALVLLALVAVAAGVFAVTRNVMSVAILAMVGAYLAPKFAIGQPSVLSIYGYYLVASILSLVMVTLRGWRPLIHLSFLFTLAGALFFGWNGRFYEPEYYALMQPLLLALTLVHLVMPLLERKYTQIANLKHFDSAYFVALPLVASALTLRIVPDLHREGAIGLGALALLWGIAGATLYASKRTEAARHTLVAVSLGVAAAFVYVQDLPWLLVGLGLSVALMAAAPKLEWARNIEELGCGAAALFGVLHIIDSIVQPIPQQPFLNELFAHRMIASITMMLGAWLGSRRKISFATLLVLAGCGWGVLSILAELLRLQIDFLPQLVYGIVLVAIALSIQFSNRSAVNSLIGGLLICALIVCGWWAWPGASDIITIAYLVLTLAALLGMAWAGRDTGQNDGSDFSPAMAIGLLPFALLPWAISTAVIFNVNTGFFEATVAMVGIAVAGLWARWWLSDSPRWNDRIQPLHVYFTAFALFYVTLLHIERGIWPVAFDVLALVYLIAYVTRRNREHAGVGFGLGAMMVLSVALVMQAMLLRGFGPDDVVMDASDINKMHLPAVASLMWVIFGAGLAWWGAQNKCRATWSAGSVLLVIAAVKLVLFDFGTLGQLGNIMAFIAAGVVFLGVAWFAPPPSKTESAPAFQFDSPSVVTQGREQSEQTSSQLGAMPQQMLQPELQVVHVSKPTNSTAKNEHSTAAINRSNKQRPTLSPRYREEPRGISVLWLILLGLSVVIALLSTAWYKHVRWQANEAKRFVQRQSVINELSQTPPVEISPLATPASSVAPLKSFELDRSNLPQRNECGFTDAKFPAEFSVYAAGAYSGRVTSYQIDQSGHQATQMDVAVNQRDKPVVLILGAYEPTIWNVGWTSGTNIVAVLIGGYHRQVITGISKSTPVLVSSYDNKGPCGYFYVAQDGNSRINPLSKQIFGRGVEMIYPANDGRIVVGRSIAANDTLVSSSDFPSAASFHVEGAPMAGSAGLEDAIRKGVLRKATQQDTEAWVAALAAEATHEDIPPAAGQAVSGTRAFSVFNGYVVLKPFVYPAGLYGGNSATFFIPRGVPKPTGNPGHSIVYDFNQMK